VLQLLSLDEAVATRLNRLTRGSPRAQQLAQVAAGSVAGGELLLLCALAVRGHFRTALRTLLAIATVYLVVEAIGLVLRRQRPFAQVGEIEELLSHHGTRSFPSRHVASAVAMTVLARSADTRIGDLMGAGAWLLGVSRVAAGLHYPSDVVAGALLGLVVGHSYERHA
jgi:undecaprenyl-diphosphatase